MKMVNFRFEIDKLWPEQKRNFIDRFCARWVARMIQQAKGDTYQFGGYTGFKRLSYEMVNADKYQLIHWILREAGYLCCPADVMERCGIDDSKREI